MQTYRTYSHVSKTQIEFNIGHDDSEVVSGLQKLLELFESQKVAKSFIVTDFGAIERYLLSSLQNIDEQVMLYSCLAIQSLIKGRGDKKIRGTADVKEELENKGFDKLADNVDQYAMQLHTYLGSYTGSHQ